MTKRLWSILIKNIRIPEFFSVHFNLHFLDPMQLPHSHIHRFHGAAAVWADAIAKTGNRCAAVGTIDTNSITFNYVQIHIYLNYKTNKTL